MFAILTISHTAIITSLNVGNTIVRTPQVSNEKLILIDETVHLVLGACSFPAAFIKI